MEYKILFADLTQQIAQMSDAQVEAFAGRILALIESAGFERLSAATQKRCWVLLDLCTR